MRIEVSHVANKKWGYEIWLVNNDLYCGKLLTLKKGAVCSYHYHPIKTETFVVYEGKVRLTVNGEEFTLTPTSEAITIEPGDKHSFYGIARSEMFEFSTHHDDTDVIRLSESV